MRAQMRLAQPPSPSPAGLATGQDLPPPPQLTPCCSAVLGEAGGQEEEGVEGGAAVCLTAQGNCGNHQATAEKGK